MSNNGEDIIRETFEKFGDAIGVQMQIPDAMIANLGAVLQAQIDLLAELQSTGRLLADDEQRLTAEQVEDVRTAREALRGYRNFTGYGRSHVNQLIAAVDALFPATEPAEEETKAEYNASVARREALGRVAQQLYEQSFDGCDGTFYHDFGRALEDFLPSQGWTRIPAVSPVVPAPTETGPQTLEGPWDRIEDVPETVGRLTDRDGDIWEWDGDNWVTPETAILPTTYINKHFAPFVAAAEEG